MKQDYIILVADDEALWLNLIKGILEGNGYQVYITTNPSEVEKLVISKKIDLVLLDVSFPEINGLTVCKNLKSNPEIEDTIIIMLTAHSDPTDLRKGFDAGADDYIEKQSSSLELLERMKVLLKSQTKNRSLFLYKKLFENSPYAMMTIKGKRIKDINRRFMDILKYDSLDELSDSNISSFIHEDEIDNFFEQLKNIELDKSDHPFPYKFKCKDDNYVTLVVHMIRISRNNEVALYCNIFS